MTNQSDSSRPPSDLEWTLLSEEVVHAGWRRVLRRRYRYPNGTSEDWEVKGDPRVVSIFCLTPEEKVVLVRQFRAGPNKLMLELPAGIIGADEDPQDAARRELLEETGYAGELCLASIHHTDSYSTLLRHVFVAAQAHKVQEAHPEGNEFLELVEVTLPEFRDLLRRGAMTDVDAGYLALDFLNLL